MFDSNQLKKWGIVDFGYTTEAVPLTINQYNDWIKDKKHLPLTYLEGIRQEKRQSIKEHWSEFESSLVFLFSYHESHQILESFYKNDPAWNGFKIASYTLGFEGNDYHHIIRDRLIEIGEFLKEDYKGLEFKLTLDTHPVLERDLALRSGLGWFGKNSMLINRHHGSFFIIGSLLLNKKIDFQKVLKIETDHCGQCRKCADACPTAAIDPELRTIRAQDCISTFTIEQFKIDTVPSEKMTLREGNIFGCDICQDVCPWNTRIDRVNKGEKDIRKSIFMFENQHKIINFFIKRDPKTIFSELNDLSEGAFKRLFKNTSFERSGKRGLYKNILFYLRELKLFSK